MRHRTVIAVGCFVLVLTRGTQMVGQQLSAKTFIESRNWDAIWVASFWIKRYLGQLAPALASRDLVMMALPCYNYNNDTPSFCQDRRPVALVLS